MPGPKPMALADRFWSKVSKSDGCWEWIGYVNATGYGMLSDQRKRSKFWAHRLAHELVKGSIPDGYQVDHLCRNRRCVNPDHLEAVTPRENVQRAYAAARGNRCKWGHEYTPENTRIRVDRPSRICIACVKQRNDARPRMGWPGINQGGTGS